MAKKASITTTVKRAIDRCGMSRYELAKRSGVSQAALSTFMAGTRGMTIELLDKLAQHIGIRVTIDP